MTLILECLGCGTCYESPPDFPPEGRKVRCAKCGDVWHAVAQEQKTDPDPLIDDDEDEEIVFRSDDEDELQAEAEPAGDEGVDDPADGMDDAEGEEEVEPEPEPVAEDTADEPIYADKAVEKIFGNELEEEIEPEEPPADPVPPVPEDGRSSSRGSWLGQLRQAADTVTLGWVALMAFLFGTFYLAYENRVAVVQTLPGTAWAYEVLGIPVNVRGLGFGPVAYNWAVEAGRPILEVEGEIRNMTDGPLKVPTVVFALRNGVDVEVYQWAADVRNEPLPGGERALFLARIPSPPKSIESVQVRFAKSR